MGEAGRAITQGFISHGKDLGVCTEVKETIDRR